MDICRVALPGKPSAIMLVALAPEGRPWLVTPEESGQAYALFDKKIAILSRYAGAHGTYAIGTAPTITRTLLFAIRATNF